MPRSKPVAQEEADDGAEHEAAHVGPPGHTRAGRRVTELASVIWAGVSTGSGSNPSGDYAPKHNPMVYFDDVTDGNKPTSQASDAVPPRATASSYDMRGSGAFLFSSRSQISRAVS